MTHAFMLQVNKGLLYVSVASNIVFAYLIFVQLRVTPQDVMNEVRTQAGQTQIQVEKSDERIREITETLENRGQWIQAIDEELTKRATTILFKQDFVKWREQVQKLNPGLNVPPLDECKTMIKKIIE